MRRAKVWYVKALSSSISDLREDSNRIKLPLGEPGKLWMRNSNITEADERPEGLDPDLRHVGVIRISK